jgi:phosphoribosylglycinamide formyltransferase-1
MCKLAVLISGRGSNLAAIAEAIATGRLRAEIVLVISNRADAPGLEFARARGIETRVIDHKAYASREAFDAALAAAIRERGATLVCLAGFMRRLGAGFCAAFPNAILNIHPSLLPAFPGEHAQQQALEHGVTIAGATVHFVTPELDAGPIIAQATVPVERHDTPESLAARILIEEHRLYPDAIRRITEEPWHLEGRRVVFEPTS